MTNGFSRPKWPDHVLLAGVVGVGGLVGMFVADGILLGSVPGLACATSQARTRAAEIFFGDSETLLGLSIEDGDPHLHLPNVLKDLSAHGQYFLALDQ